MCNFTRAYFLTLAYKYFSDGASEENLYRSFVLGWCFEMVRNGFTFHAVLYENEFNRE